MIAALAATIIASCPWPDRGLDRYMGDVPSAVDTYTDIPKPVREILKARMQDPRQYDDIAHLTAAGQRSERWEYSQPTMMHFGDGRKICATIDVSMWAPTDPGERGLVYCESGHCVIVYTVCRNVSRVERLRARTTPPPAMTTERPDAEVPPVPVAVDAPIPPVEPGPLADEFTPQTFARLSLPEPPPAAEPDPERIGSGQSFYDLWQWRPLFGPVAFVLPRTGFAIDAPVIAPPRPVPGVLPVSPVFSIPRAPNPAAPQGEPGSVAPAAVVPEPGTLALMPCGLGWLAWVTRRRNAKGEQQ